MQIVCLGEWEICAFNPTLKAKGMSVRYSVFNCERELRLVDTDDYDDLEEHIEKHFPIPRGFRKRNRTVALQICQKVSTNTSQTKQQNTTKMPLGNEEEKDTLVCTRKLVPVDEADDLDVLSQGGIPQDILDQLNMDMGSLKRQKRLVLVENNTEATHDHDLSRSHRTDPESMSPRETEIDDMVGMKDNKTVSYQDVDQQETLKLEKSPPVDLFKKFIQKVGLNMTSDLGPKSNLTERSRRQTWEKNIGEATKSNDAMSENDVLKDSVLEVDKLMETIDLHKYAYKNEQHLDLSSQYSPSGSSQNGTYPKNLSSLEYDDYEDDGNKTTLSFSSADEIGIRSGESKFRSYYIAAEEIMWDYGIDKPAQLISARWSTIEYMF